MQPSKTSKTSPNRLGRGLSALLTPGDHSFLEPPVTSAPDHSSPDQILYVPLKKIRPGKWQPRQRFNDQDIEQLAKSIEKNGVLQPILAHYQAEDDSYHIIAGERRWRAALRAQLQDMPVLVKHDVPEAEALTIALVENVQRTDLSAIEEAFGYQRLLDTLKSTQEDIADLVGKSRSHVANILRLLQLPKSIQDILHNLEISPGHARCLIGLDEKEALSIIDEIIHKKLNVRQVERLIKLKKEARSPKKTSLIPPLSGQPSFGSLPVSGADPEETSLAQIIEERLGLSTQLVSSGAGGTIVLTYESFDALDSFLNRISRVSLSDF